MILACLLWAVSCAERGAAEAGKIGAGPAASLPAVGGGEAVALPAEEDEVGEGSAALPDGMRILRLEDNGEEKPIPDFTFAPGLTVLYDGGGYEASRPSCTWTKDGQTLIACGVEPLTLGQTLDPVPLTQSTAGASCLGLRFDNTPDRITVSFWLLPEDGGQAGADESGEPTEAEYYEPENGYLFPEEGECVFMIRAEWDVVDGFGGEGVYVFHTRAEG